MNMQSSIRSTWIVLGFLSILILSCSQEKASSTNTNTYPKESVQITSEGHRLALTYCQGCHVFPEPALLDTGSWRKVVKHMGYRLGINAEEGYANMATLDRQLLQMQAVFPEKPLLSEADFKKLKDYYLSNAPTILVEKTSESKSEEQALGLFKPIFPISQANDPPLTTLVKFLSDSVLAIGDYEDKVSLFKQDFNTPLHTINSGSPPVSMLETEDHYYLLCVGNIFPNDLGTGSLHQLNKESTNTRLSKTISETLVRPVYLSKGALSNNTAEDIVVSNYGYFTGSLSAFSKKGDTYQRANLNNETGNHKTIIEDVNQDGLNDILTLKAQGNEGIFVHLNQGNGNFVEKPLLQFPPVYGSSNFEWIDFNQDGLKDIIYCNGDNADYSPVLKPYHGIRIFLNQGGDLLFKESQFLPIHGASKSITYDFDQDGDLDIAAIAFFPDFQNTPQQGFVYFEQTSTGKFERRTTKEASKGRWLTMDKGDLDQDGDMDLILGNFTYSQIPIPDTLQREWAKLGHKIMYLENTLLMQ